MRRLIFICGLLVLLSACGRKNVQVKAPPAASVSSSELEGVASYYAEPYHGRRTASGEVFDTYERLTAAHRTLPFHTVVRVTNKTNGREVDVTINDRGPFIEGRVIDLSLRAAREIDMVRAGIAPVTLKILQLGEYLTRSSAVRPRAAYTVQVGAFENMRTAEDLKKALENKKYQDVRIQVFLGEKKLYRVRLGRDSDIQDAHKLAAALNKDGFQSFVVRAN